VPASRAPVGFQRVSLPASWLLARAQETAERAALSGEPAAVPGGFGLSAEYRHCLACRADSFARCRSHHGIGCWQSSGPRFRCGFYRGNWSGERFDRQPSSH
jgi:hypothetical protein